MELTFVKVVDRASQVMDLAGVVIIVGGALLATGHFALQWKDRASGTQYRRYRQSVGRAILLGLEFLLAADIVRTVAIDPTFRSVGVLAVIVAIRTFLSLELELEIDGRWPWQRDSAPRSDHSVSVHT